MGYVTDIERSEVLRMEFLFIPICSCQEHELIIKSRCELRLNYQYRLNFYKYCALLPTIRKFVDEYLYEAYSIASECQ
ncbi:hypothetical protein BpHYR1_018294 [Brachionus plicatilis]|uniref:Uncharacterized protein n=1 Tax=Brachionus plicatilis TaxID=10195 RepID=A0A3M7PBW6_BRAPC|nr:hypothetical protein BpHYR1_018294 [Brachionus plicatilis]